ncbi:MAG: 3-deoxy-manno-octulosonate cytidylyltransferase [Bacteroidales bacterium]
MKIAGIIPARYESSRFPGKPLIEIKGKPMIIHTMENAASSPQLAKIIVATDDERIKNTVQNYGGNCILTSKSINSGTARCAAALEQLNEPFDAVINIQGDEPLIHQHHINAIVKSLESQSEIATLAKKISSDNELQNPNIVKVVINTYGKALYFSRFPIPYIRNLSGVVSSQDYVFYKHIGLYGYQTNVLKNIVRLPPSGLEEAEKLEQLRWLDHNYSIHAEITTQESFGIDTPEDLKELEKFMNHF